MDLRNISKEWGTAVVIPIHKKGDRNNPDNYKGISLLNTGYKIYSKMIAKRLTVIAEALLLEGQNGFRKGRSFMDCIFSASQIIEKHREFNITRCIAFIDLKKAFDSVDRDKLWTIMSSKGIPTHLITIIRTIYKGNIIRINAGNGVSEDSRVITQGERQDCPLSPFLFNLDEVFRKRLKKLKTIKYFNELIFNTLLFADDQFIIYDTEDNFQRAVYLLYNISKEYNLEIATKRRRYLVSLGQIT